MGSSLTAEQPAVALIVDDASVEREEYAAYLTQNRLRIVESSEALHGMATAAS